MINKKLRQTAIQLRKQGKSYSQIQKELGIPKSTLSNWFSGKSWSKSITEQLNQKWKEKNKNRILKINTSRKLETVKRHNSYRKKAREEFEDLIDNPLFLTGLSIYWGEGEKTFNGRVSVINSDLRMLQVIRNFYTKLLGVNLEKIRAAVFVYSDHNPKEAVKFWSKNLEIPSEQFIKTQILPSRSSLTNRKVKHGMCSVYFSNTELNIKIKEWIKLLAKNMRE